MRDERQRDKRGRKAKLDVKFTMGAGKISAQDFRTELAKFGVCFNVRGEKLKGFIAGSNLTSSLTFASRSRRLTRLYFARASLEACGRILRNEVFKDEQRSRSAGF